MTTMAPAMTALPPLNLNLGTSAAATAKGGDGAFGGGSGVGVTSGDWNVSYGKGDATSSGGINWLYIGLAAAALWWIKNR